TVFRFLTRPLDLNRAGAEEFRLLPFLTEPEIEAILRHRAQYGRFSAIEELQAVEGLPLAQARRLRHYCVLYPETGLARLLTGFWENRNHSLTVRTIFRSDLQRDARYAGSPARWYGRYRLARPGAYSVGVIVEKDPGETGLDWSPNQGRTGP